MLRSGGGPVTLAVALTRLSECLDVLAGVDLTSVTDAEMAEGVVASRRLLLRWRSLDAAIAGRFASSDAWADEARSATGWLTQKTHAGEGETRTRLRLADDTSRHPVMGRAVAAGEVSVEHLRELAKAHRKLPALAAELDAVEGVITDYARTATPTQLRGFLEQLARNIAPDVVDDAERDRLEDRAHLTVTELLDGWVAVAGMLPPELGGRLLTALRALILPITIETSSHPITDAGTGADAGDGAEAGKGTGTDSGSGSSSGSDRSHDTHDLDGDQAGSSHDAGGVPVSDAPASNLPPEDPPPGATTAGAPSEGDVGGDDGRGQEVDACAGGVPRPLPQRMLDALARMLDYLADTQLDGTGFPRLRGHLPIVTITVPLAEFTAEAGDGVATLLTPAARNPVVASAETARKHACDAVIRRLVLDPAGIPLDVGRRQRTVSPALALAVQHRDRHCRWPGCRQRIDHAHHVVHWAHGGTTDLPNLIGLCAFHHQVAHTGDWTLHGDANTRITIRPTSSNRSAGRTSRGGDGGQTEMTSRPPSDGQLGLALDKLRQRPPRL